MISPPVGPGATQGIFLGGVDDVTRPFVISAKVSGHVAHQLNELANLTGDTVSGLIQQAVSDLIAEHQRRFEQYRLVFGDFPSLPGKQKDREAQEPD